MVLCKFKSDLSQWIYTIYLIFFFSLVKWMKHIILNLYCTFDKRYFCLLSDLLYEIIVVFGFFFPFVWDIYLNIFLNIIIYILVYSGYHIIVEKTNILWSTDISVLIAAMFYLQKYYVQRIKKLSNWFQIFIFFIFFFTNNVY
jgi:hypothetical protein